MAHGAIRDRELPFEYLGCVVSNPRAELAVDNAKYIKACTELHLAGKKIEVIWGFDRFVNLEELWLNNNKLTAIENLESNFRLKKVYAHDNQITSLANSLQHCKFLDTLIVSNNAITDLKATIAELEGFQYLHNLELRGNPLAEEPNYRLYVIFKLPSLHVFDRHVVTQDERIAANRKFGRRRRKGTQASGGSRRKHKPPAAAATALMGGTKKQPLSGCERDLAREVRLIKADMQAKELAELEAAYSAGVRKNSGGHGMLRSAAMTMSRTLLGQEMEAASSSDAGKAKAKHLSEWDIFRLTQVFNKFDDNKSGTISRDEFRHAMDEAQDMGLKLSIVKDSALLDQYFVAMDKDGDENVGIKEFIAAIEGELHDPDGNPLPPLEFEAMLPHEAKARSEYLFKQAADIQAQLLPMPADDPRRPALTQRAFRLSETAGRLADLHFENDRAARAKAPPMHPARRGGGGGGGGGGRRRGGGGGGRAGAGAGSGGACKPRSDYVTFISTVRVRSDPARNATVSAIDSGSDSDSDDEEGKAPSGGMFDELRKKRRGRKPRRVMQSTVNI